MIKEHNHLILEYDISDGSCFACHISTQVRERIAQEIEDVFLTSYCGYSDCGDKDCEAARKIIAMVLGTNSDKNVPEC